jgi:putative Holliday junction resolvase
VSERTRLLGVDFGRVRVGLAVSDAERRIASPLATYTRRGEKGDADHFRELIEREEVGGLVVGLPLHTNGREGEKAREARAFGAWLARVAGLPVVFWDERFTTVEAESHLWNAGLTHKKRQQRRDAVAAQLLLQAYLDAGCPPEPPAAPFDDPGSAGSHDTTPGAP